MEIQYKRTYTPGIGKRYTVGEISAMLGYAMEIADPRARMQEGRMAPGQVCMLLFALTPEEYALKDSDTRALNALADRLLKVVPADRLLGWRMMDLKGAVVKSDLRPQTGESIDDGELARRVRAGAAVEAGPIDVQLREARRLQQLCAAKDAPEGAKQDWQRARSALGEALLGLDQVYAAYDAATGERWPALGFDGRMELFTTLGRAQRVQKQLSDAQAGADGWSIHALTGAEFRAQLSSWAEDGLELVRVDNGFAAAELSIRDFCDCASGANAALRGMMIREVEYGLRWNRLREANADEARVRGALESMLTLRNFVWREVGNAALYVLCAGGNREKCVVLGSKDRPEKMLAVFTDAERARAFAGRMKEAAKAVEMRFDELAQRSAGCDGLLIDMGFIGYRLLKQDYDKVRELRAKPPVVVRVQAQNAPQEAPRPAEDMGTLPDPDEFAPAAKREAPQTQAEPEPSPQQEEKKKSRNAFLKKLFGK